jgi:hypothetical protein
VYAAWSTVPVMPALADVPRIPLTFDPSPAHRLDRLSEHPGGEVESPSPLRRFRGEPAT